jgi:cytochrome P450
MLAPPDPSAIPLSEEELIANLERDQLVSETARPLPPARLGRRTSTALWTLRVFVIIVGAMVTYTFIHQLH